MTKTEIEATLNSLDTYKGQSCDAEAAALCIRTLQQELDDVRAKALAAVWLISEDVTLISRDLHNLKNEALEVFMGKDKEHIAILQDKVSNLEADLRNTKRPKLGISGVFGRKDNIDSPLSVFHLTYDKDGHAHIGVYLP